MCECISSIRLKFICFLFVPFDMKTFFRIVIFNKEINLFNADTSYHQIHIKIFKGEMSITLISDWTEDVKLCITCYVLV